MKKLLASGLLMLVIMCVKTYREEVRTEEISHPRSSILYAAQQEWPEDTSGGLTAIGTSAPAKEGDDVENLKLRAEHGALLRLFSSFRSKGISSEITEDMFYACVELQAKDMFVRKQILKFDRVEISVHMKEEQIQKVFECLKQYDGE